MKPSTATISRSRKAPAPLRGEIWWVNFDPSLGEEIRKLRPALVVGLNELGRTGLRIIVPVTKDKGRYRKAPWFFRLRATKGNSLTVDSEVDASQVKSISVQRFKERIGTVTAAQLSEIVEGIALCIGYECPICQKES